MNLCILNWRIAARSFVVAQRISTVLTADKIVVLDKAAVADVGTHPNWLAAANLQEIYQSQLGMERQVRNHELAVKRLLTP
jgi:ATP-binding cassette subfamily B protein